VEHFFRVVFKVPVEILDSFGPQAVEVLLHRGEVLHPQRDGGVLEEVLVPLLALPQRLLGSLALGLQDLQLPDPPSQFDLFVYKFFFGEVFKRHGGILLRRTPPPPAGSPFTIMLYGCGSQTRRKRLIYNMANAKRKTDTS
jgi:hypothetical protein